MSKIVTHVKRVSALKYGSKSSSMSKSLPTNVGCHKGLLNLELP